MKRIAALAALAALLLTGCAAPEPSNQDLGWEEDWVRVGTLLGVEPAEGFTLHENKDILGASGLYYADWTGGEARTITNDAGEEAQLYDVQIYLLLRRCRDENEARSEAESWQDREKKNYDTGDGDSKSFAGQEFFLLPLLSGSEENPYSCGAAAFAVRGEWAICAELLRQDGSAEDCLTGLEDFLAGLHYTDE